MEVLYGADEMFAVSEGDDFGVHVRSGSVVV
jgi:hypothetical protein